MISNVCSIFAESEVINLINEEVLARRVGLEKDIVITGGMAKNRAVVEMLEGMLKLKFVTFPEDVDPQIVGALGAAVIGSEKV